MYRDYLSNEEIREERNGLKFIKDNLFKIAFWTLVLSMAALLLIVSLNYNDAYWHIKTGEYIAETGTIPKTGIYSWYALENNLPWIAHEWLFAVLIFFIEKIGDRTGVFLYALITSLMLLGMICFNLRKRAFRIPSIFSFIWISFAIFSISSIQAARPHMFMFLFIGTTMMILYKFKEKPDTKLIYVLPISSILWANLHGGSSNMVYLLPVLLVITQWIPFQVGKLVGERIDRKYLIRLLLITIVSAILIAVNPNGVEMITYPYVNMGDGLMLKLIDEWQSADVKDIFHLLIIFAPLVLNVLIFSITEKKIKFTDLLFFGFFAYMSLRSVRFSFLLYFIQSLMLFDYVGKSEEERDGINDGRLAIVLFLLAAILFTFKAYIFKGVEYTEYLSEEMIERISEEKPERILNEYGLGAYLIYRDIPVFIDGRADMYSNNILGPLADFTDAKIEDVDAFLQEYDFDYAIFRKEDAVNHILQRTDGAKLLFSDEYAHLYRLEK